MKPHEKSQATRQRRIPKVGGPAALSTKFFAEVAGDFGGAEWIECPANPKPHSIVRVKLPGILEPLRFQFQFMPEPRENWTAFNIADACKGILTA